MEIKEGSIVEYKGELGKVRAFYEEDGQWFLNTDVGNWTCLDEEDVKNINVISQPIMEKGIIDELVEELKKDKEPGSYYHSWQSNIAMAIHDELKGKATVEECNAGAKRFLDLLIS